MEMLIERGLCVICPVLLPARCLNQHWISSAVPWSSWILKISKDGDELPSSVSALTSQKKKKLKSDTQTSEVTFSLSI